MKEKVLSFIQSMISKVNIPSISNKAMRYIIWYALLLVFCCMLYIGSWCVDWYINGKPNVIEMRNFLHEIASTPWIAVIGFICKSLIDRDNDGIPDNIKEDDDDTRAISKRDR